MFWRSGLRWAKFIVVSTLWAGLSGCSSTTMRYVEPADGTTLDVGRVKLVWRVIPPLAEVEDCAIETGPDENVDGERWATNKLARDAPGTYSSELVLPPGVHFWRVVCADEYGPRLVTRDPVAGATDAHPRLSEKPRRFEIVGLLDETPVAKAEAVVNRPRQVDASAIIRPFAGVPMPKDGSVAVVASRWNDQPSEEFADELEARLVELGFVVQQSRDLVEQHAEAKEPRETKGPHLLADSLVFTFESPPTGQLNRPDRLLLVESRTVAFDPEILGSEAREQARKAEVTGTSNYPDNLRAVYARLIDAKNGRIIWTDRFYAPPGSTMSRVISELMRR